MNIELGTDLYTISEILASGIDSFEIKSYQRGYRWDIENIQTLINDINECSPQFVYCLQPLVVTKLEDKVFEIIDGQQRLTTLKILLHCLNRFYDHDPIAEYTINYETRSCKTFLIKLFNNEFNVELIELELANVKRLWDGLDLLKEEINRDNFHLFQSYLACNFLFKGFDKLSLKAFAEKIRTKVKFIWYPTNLNELNITAERLFQNINKNKIRLTGADLIKALFILDIEKDDRLNIEVKHYKKQSLASEWDEIEQCLRNPDFWFFFTNSKEQHYDVRIGKLFDVITENKKESDLGSYFLMNTNDNLRNWSKVYQSFKIAYEWYENIYLYHRIGFLINMNLLSFDEILKKYNHEETRSKNEFQNWLNGEIKQYMKLVDLSSLDYEKHSGRFGLCTGTLVLYNILLVEKYYPHQKFSFGDFVEEEWSLEHIQPQKPKKKNAQSWVVWLNEIEPVINDKFESTEQKILKVDQDHYSISEINFEDLVKSLAILSDVSSISKELLTKLEVLQDIFEEEYPTHKIQNLALLDRNTNSKLSNGSFKQKRELILQINVNEENQAVYLPLGTLNVFSKSMITQGKNIQMEYWSLTDSEFYLAEITKILIPYTV